MNGNKNSIIDDRLRLCASFVRDGSRLADIGTDHAYLPVWLCRIGKCSCAIAADVNPEPLKRGYETIADAGMTDLVKTRLSDGLKEINIDEADDIVIAGMGGELIAKIILESAFKNDSSKHFILQPMTKSEYLIKWLCDNGFSIIKQDCCVAAKKCYTVILAKYTGEAISCDEMYYYIGKLKPEENEIHSLFVQNHITRLLKKAKGDIHYSELADELKELLNKSR
ncbi:MAG: class I SAM-dependent methyltransferase [Ruminococcus sp.]|nr:class I SAM-dependent methyltransferase [Ruminococcus sp.]